MRTVAFYCKRIGNLDSQQQVGLGFALHVIFLENPFIQINADRNHFVCRHNLLPSYRRLELVVDCVYGFCLSDCPWRDVGCKRGIRVLVAWLHSGSFDTGNVIGTGIGLKVKLGIKLFLVSAEVN